jgi:hypothetical protein
LPDRVIITFVVTASHDSPEDQIDENPAYL